jgi:5-methylthioribose kinase
MRLIDISTSHKELNDYLFNQIGVFDPAEKVVKVEIPGEGNMNVVLRIQTNKRSFILKQSRPFVNKYPEIISSKERIVVENKFYNEVLKKKIKVSFPNKIKFVRDDFVLILEDLGVCKDMTYLYNKNELSDIHINKLIQIISSVHSLEVKKYPLNMGLRKLNHEHIFVLPFKKNNFLLNTIQDELLDLSKDIIKNSKLKMIVKKIGDKYLGSGKELIHGDYYPGSWMIKNNNIYIIDPEFSFLGFKEFDLGVMAAHLIMITHNRDCFYKIINEYSSFIDEKLIRQVAGIEIIRRIIGLAQLPINRTLIEKKALLSIAKEMIIKNL